MIIHNAARKFVLTFLLLFLVQSFAWSQANVDESQETARIYVDVVHGLDTNLGTKAKPLQSITAGVAMAVKNNQAGIGSKVIINPGTYRESVQFYGTLKDTTKPITLAAATAGTAIISGADVWTGWQVYTGNSSIYTHAWPYQWGLCSIGEWDDPATEEDIVRRREMIFVNSAPLTQVLTLSAMRAGTFYVDETHALAYVWAGTDVTKATVEVSTRDLLFNVGRRNNLVLRGLTFQYASSCRADPAVIIHNSNNVLLGKNFFYWNNSTGLKLFATTNTTVRHTVAKFNGTSGTKGQKTKNDLWDDLQSRYNGWRGAQGIYYKWGEAAVHFGLAHNSTLTKVESSWNQTHGFHWDTDNVDDTADSLIASQNLLDGMVVEKTEGPFTISNSYFCNGNPMVGPNSDGITLRNSSSITLSDNFILNNKNQVVVTGEPAGIPITNWETGQHYLMFTENTTFTGNTAQAAPGGKIFMDPILGDTSWEKFQTSLVSDYNTYWIADTTLGFTVPTPGPWSKLDLAGWQTTSGSDAHSVWKSPGKPQGRCAIAPEGSDFWFIMDFQDGYQTVQGGAPALFPGQVVTLGFSGTVDLSVDGVQNIPGATSSWSTDKIVNSGLSTLTVTTTQSTPPGRYDLTLLATNGNKTRAMSVTVIVN